MAIPKIVHYCWFGGKEKPDSVKKCIESWKKFLPDYQLMEWNEDNFNIEKLKYSIPEITDIRATSYHDFRLSQYKDMDVIINTTGEEIHDDRVVAVDARLSERGIELVRQKVNQIYYFRKREEFHFNSLCHQLFDVDLFLLKPEVENKDQLITMMVKKLEEKGDVTPNYLQSVFDRERATTTSIGRGVAIPHGNMTEVNEPKIVVAILDKPISWHDDMVDVVFLLAVKMTSQVEIKRTKQFYKDFLQLTGGQLGHACGNGAHILLPVLGGADFYQTIFGSVTPLLHPASPPKWSGRSACPRPRPSFPRFSQGFSASVLRWSCGHPQSSFDLG